MNLRAPLAAVLGHGSAKSGSHHWWVQRLTAIALVPLTLWFVFSLLELPLDNYQTLRIWVASGWTALWLILLVAIVSWHSHLGVQVVIEDYVHAKGVKLVSLLAVSGAHLLVAAAGVFAVLKIALQS